LGGLEGTFFGEVAKLRNGLIGLSGRWSVPKKSERGGGAGFWLFKNLKHQLTNKMVVAFFLSAGQCLWKSVVSCIHHPSQHRSIIPGKTYNRMGFGNVLLPLMDYFRLVKLEICCI